MQATAAEKKVNAALIARDTAMRYLGHLESRLRIEAKSAQIQADGATAMERAAQADNIMHTRQIILGRPQDETHP